MATVEQLTIQFEGKGAPALTGQLNALSAAMNRLAGRQKQVTKSTKKGSTATDSYNNRLTKNGRNVQALTASFGKFGMRMSQMRSKLLIVAFAVGIVTKAFKSLTDAFAEYSKLNFRINALLKTTQFAAGKTAKSLDNMANSLEKTMGVSSTQVKEIQQRLLTFTNIVGASFDGAIEQSINLSAVMGTDAKDAAIQLGKALNDPMRGYTSLRRVGVSFSQTQIRLIKQFQEAGDIYKAQGVILEALEGQIGGAAAAQKDAAVGTEKWRVVGEQFGASMRAWGEVLQPVIYALGLIGQEVVNFIAAIPRAVLGIRDLMVSFQEFMAGTQGLKESIQLESALISQFTALKQAYMSIEYASHKTRKSIEHLAEEQEGWTNLDDLENMREWAVKHQQDLGKLTEGSEKYNTKLKMRDDALVKHNLALQKNNQIIAGVNTSERALTVEYNKSIEAVKFKIKVAEMEQQVNKKGEKSRWRQILIGDTQLSQRKKLILAHGGLTDEMKEQLKVLEELTKREEKYQIVMQAKTFLINHFRDLASERMAEEKAQGEERIEAIDREEQIELDALRNTWRYKKATDESKAKLEKDIRDEMASERKKAEEEANAQMKRQFLRDRALRASEAIINTARAVTEALPNKWKAVWAALQGAIQVKKN